MGWHTVRKYQRASIRELFQGAFTADEVTGLLLAANQRLTNASEDTRRKWHKAAERRLAELREPRTAHRELGTA